MENSFSRKIALFFAFAWLVLVGTGLALYAGSSLVFLAFSLAYGAMLWGAFYKEFSYGYFFLSAMLLLGFWVKLIVHLIFPAPYIEPVGSFSQSSDAWDEVLWVATVAALAMTAVRVLWVSLVGFWNSKEPQVEEFVVPRWYQGIRMYLWAAVLVLIVLTAVINSRLGIHQIGLAPRTVLVFPLNAAIAWLLNAGLITIVATLLWWDLHLHRRSVLPLYAILAEAFCSSVSVLSRGVFVFHILPQLVAYYRNRKYFMPLPRWQYLAVMSTVAILFSIGFSVVDTLRGYYYRSDADDFRGAARQTDALWKAKEQELLQLMAKSKSNPKPDPRYVAEFSRLERELVEIRAQSSAEKLELKTAERSALQRMRLLLAEFWAQWPSVVDRAVSLATNRWIGLEGVMALQAYPDKSLALLKKGLAERYVDGVVPMYQHISKSIYTGMDPNQWKFGSLPGAPAFLYYSGSLLIVFLGMALLTASLHIFEVVVRAWTKNPFLASFYGFAAANTIAQFGVVPRQVVPVVVTWVCGIAVVGYVQGLGGIGRTGQEVCYKKH